MLWHVVAGVNLVHDSAAVMGSKEPTRAVDCEKRPRLLALAPGPSMPG